MSGIYIHIPFCRKRCNYCDFFKSTNLELKSSLLDCLKIEIADRVKECGNDEIKTVYFGGGTPSVLSSNELDELLHAIFINYRVSPQAEITLEANPDDLNPEYLSSLSAIGFNRLSIGIQSFSAADLELMNRRHNVLQAIQSVKWAQQAGFSNISIDLIYGLPNQTIEAWKHNVYEALSLDIQHISAYCLTYHEGTVFYKQLTKGQLFELPGELSLLQFETLIDLLTKAGFEHYEISNFCKPGFRSKHNSSYWKNEKYIGIGPSAHSFDLESRRWNVSSVQKYINGIISNEPCFEFEQLTEQDRYNDYIITGLRTGWGISEERVKTSFNSSYLSHFQKVKEKYKQTEHLICNEDNVRLNTKGFFISDKIMVDFMVVGTC